MIAIVFLNAIVYVAYSLHLWNKQKTISIYLLLVLMYTFTSVMCFLYAYSNPKTYPNIDIIPFVYLFATLLVFLLPIKKMPANINILSVKNESKINYLAYLCIALAFYDVATSFAHSSELIQSGAWNELRNQTYTDAESVVLYDNQYQRLAKNILSYLQPLILAYTFYQLTKPKIRVIFTTFLFLSILLPSFIAAVNDASRGMVVSLIIKLVIAYLLFKDVIPKERKKYIFSGFVIALILFSIYLIAVTVSRFDDDGAKDSIFFYFGHSMLAFNDGLFDKLEYYAYGKKFFGYFIDMFGGNSYFDTTKAGSTCSGAFVTFIGSLYIDFGSIGTIVVGIIAYNIMKPFFCKKNMLLSDTIFVIFYASTMANGIFVSPNNRALTWLMIFIVYLITRKFEK